MRRVKYNKDTDVFTVIAVNLKDRSATVEIFTHVVVCSGVFGPPFVPDVPGIGQFRGNT